MWHPAVLPLATGAVDPSTNPILSWVSYGAVGVVAVAFFMDWLVSGRSYHRVEQQQDRALDELAKARDKIDSLQATVIGTALQEIAKNAAMLEALMPMFERVMTRLDQIERLQSRRDE